MRSDKILKVEVRVTLPGGKIEDRCFVIAERPIVQMFEALPRNREIFWESEAQRQAHEMNTKRRQFSRYIAERLTAEIIKAVEAQDPRFGYDAEEWKAMHNTEDTENEI